MKDETARPHLLMVRESHYDEYGDCETNNIKFDMLDREQAIWYLTWDQIDEYQKLFRQNDKYRSHFFKRVEVADQVTTATLEADLIAYRVVEAEKKAKVEATNAKRKAAAEATRLEKKRKQLEKDQNLRAALYADLKKEFEGDDNVG